MALKEMQANFECESRMGSGTYGVVFSARSPSGRRSAIKYNLKLAPCDFVGCLRELDINRQLSLHPHVIPLNRIAHGEPFQYSTQLKRRVGISRDKIHFIYPLAEGNLSEFMCKHVKITLPELHRYMAELLLAVEYLHGLGYIHRDIKSENVLVMRENGNYHLKLADFGLSKPYNTFQPHTPGVMTCCYRAPEIVLGARNYDQRADIWSVGCVFFEMVSCYPLINTSSDDNFHILQVMATSLPYHVSTELLTRMDRTGISRTIKWQKVGGDCERFLGLIPGGGAIFEYCGGLAVFWDFLMLLLAFDPDARYSASEALEHPWMEPHSEYCSKVRVNYQPRERTYPPYHIIEGEVRSWYIPIVMGKWNARNSHRWYGHQILFHSLAVMDRVLAFGIEKVDSRYDRRKVELLYLTCLYLSVKYYTTLQDAIPFVEVAGINYSSNSSIGSAEMYESRILSKVLNYEYYRPTPYDLLCRKYRPTESDVYTLLFFMLVGHHNGRTSHQALEFWIQHKSYYERMSGCSTCNSSHISTQ